MEWSVARLNAGTPEAIDALDELIQEQAYRIAFWKVATEKINYRRFFDVSDLIGMRVEDPAVFEAGHKLILELVRAGKIDGLRVDHIDGLADPLGYQKKLTIDDVYVVVEKILVGSEEVRDDWPVQGTTGYDFLGTVNSLFVEPEGLERLTSHYEKLTGSTRSFEDVAYQRKLHVISTLFPGEMQDLGAHLASLAEEDRNARDLSARDITQAITEITACMPVYRTYTDSLSASPHRCRVHRCSSQRGSAPESGHQSARVRLHFAGTDPSVQKVDVGSQPRALVRVRYEMAATQRPHHGKGCRRFSHVCVQPADLSE